MSYRDKAKQRFWAKVAVCVHGISCHDCCWPWQAHIGTHGYGMFHFEGRDQTASHVAYVLFREDLADGHVPDHLCRVRACVNFWHLEAVTVLENNLRGNAAGLQVRKTHCPAGHPYVQGRIHRVCVICRRQHQARYKKRKRERIHALLGEDHHFPHARITPSVVRWMRIARAEGVPVKDIAAMSGFSLYYTYAIIRRDKWPDV
jgi:hypothetical protein